MSGIAYYKFCSASLPILDAPDLGNFRNGPLDAFGERTPTWHWLRHVNRQVHNLAPILTRLRSDDVYHFGAGAVPKFNRGPGEKSLVKDAGNNGHVVVGDFTLARRGRQTRRALRPARQQEPEPVLALQPDVRHQAREGPLRLAGHRRTETVPHALLLARPGTGRAAEAGVITYVGPISGQAGAAPALE